MPPVGPVTSTQLKLICLCGPIGLFTLDVDMERQPVLSEDNANCGKPMTSGPLGTGGKQRPAQINQKLTHDIDIADKYKMSPYLILRFVLRDGTRFTTPPIFFRMRPRHSRPII